MKTETAEKRFNNLPEEVRNDFLKVLNSVPSFWNLDTSVGQRLAESTKDFVIGWVNQYTLNGEEVSA